MEIGGSLQHYGRMMHAEHDVEEAAEQDEPDDGRARKETPDQAPQPSRPPLGGYFYIYIGHVL